MADAERIEEAYRRIGTRNSSTNVSKRPRRSSMITSRSYVAPMDLGNAQVKTLSPAGKQCVSERVFAFAVMKKGTELASTRKAGGAR